MQHIGPFDGLLYPENKSWDTAGAMVDTQAEMVTGRSVPLWNRATVAQQAVDQSGVGSITRGGRPSNYKGRRFGPKLPK